ncbi:MAG: hypothetical protein NT094_03200, partial [Candidatus Staskawiczbacteria bacterium]|nr:hypothetical protein [Candidatus Staskawiczbacteria bacterium]
MEFSEESIKKYLDLKAYEKRGMTKEQYIKLCKEEWDKKDYDPKTQRKVIIDFLFQVTFADIIGVSETEFDYFESLGNAPVKGFEGRTDIECIVSFAAKRELYGDKIELADINEAIQPTKEYDFKDLLTPQLYLIALFDVLGFSN